jgi:hypothetical protein
LYKAALLGISPIEIHQRDLTPQESIVKVTLSFDQKVELSRQLIVISRSFLMNSDEDELKSLTRTKIDDAMLYANGHL